MKRPAPDPSIAGHMPKWMRPNVKLLEPSETLYKRANRAKAKLDQRLALGGIIHTPGKPNNRKARRAAAKRLRKQNGKEPKPTADTDSKAAINTGTVTAG